LIQPSLECTNQTMLPAALGHSSSSKAIWNPFGMAADGTSGAARGSSIREPQPNAAADVTVNAKAHVHARACEMNMRRGADVRAKNNEVLTWWKERTPNM